MNKIYIIIVDEWALYESMELNCQRMEVDSTDYKIESVKREHCKQQ